MKLNAIKSVLPPLILPLPPIVLSFGGATCQRGQKPRTQNKRRARRRSGSHVIIFPPKFSRHFSRHFSRAPGLSGEGPLADAHIAPLLPSDSPPCFRPPLLQGFRGVLVRLARRFRRAWHCHLRWRNLLSGYQPKALSMVRKAHHLCNRHFGSLCKRQESKGSVLWESERKGNVCRKMGSW